jgi:amino-acid N-acetyltransferase
MGVVIRPARQTDEQFIETLLDDNDLPVADVPSVLDCLSVCETDDGQIGVGGIEQYGDVALLRSVAVDESERGAGHGTELCAELLDDAREAGVSDVYLLTETAPDFFADLGFERIDRDAAPDPIQDTTEFRDLCPSTAICMTRALEDTATE